MNLTPTPVSAPAPAPAPPTHRSHGHRPPLALTLPPLPPLPSSLAPGAPGAPGAPEDDDEGFGGDHDLHVSVDPSPSPLPSSSSHSLGHGMGHHGLGHGRSDSGSCCASPHSYCNSHTFTRRARADDSAPLPPSSATSISCASTTLLNHHPTPSPTPLAPPIPLPSPPLSVALRTWFRHLRRAPLATLSHTLSLWPLCRSRHDLALFVLAWTYFSLCSYITCLANSTVDRYNPNNVVPINERTVLMDPGMQTLATAYSTYVHGPRDVSDWFVRLCSVLMVTRAVLHRERAATVLRRACYVGGTLYLLRAQTVLMTVLPNPLLECESKPHPSVWYDAFLLFTQQRASCGDVFFSGHSIIFMTNLNLWWVYGHNWVAKATAMLTSIIAVVSLLASSYHYSIDVWTACILCLTAFFLYHWTATGQIGHGTWWGFLIQLVDGDERFRARACRRSRVGSPPCILPSTHHAATAKLAESAATSNSSMCSSCASWWDHHDTQATRGVWWMPGSGARLPRYQRVNEDDDGEQDQDLVSVVSSSASSLAQVGGGADGACRVAPLAVRGPPGKPIRVGSGDMVGEGLRHVSASAPAPLHQGIPGTSAANAAAAMSVPRRASLMAQRPGMPRIGVPPPSAVSAAHMHVGGSRDDQGRGQDAVEEEEEQGVHESETGGGTSDVWRK